MKYISITEFAERVGCSRQNIHQAIQSGKVEANKIGTTYIISEDQLDKFFTKKED